MRIHPLMLTALALTTLWAGPAARGEDSRASYIRVSPRDVRYLETADGQPYIPNGLNLISPPWVRSNNPQDRLDALDAWLGKLEANGGNYIRVWISNEFYEVEHEKAGQYDAERAAQRIDAMLAIARKHGIRVKMTIEHFREIDPAHPRQSWAVKAVHHTSRGGLANTMEEWMESPAARKQFVGKLEFLAARYRDNPTVYGWELWNEMNAVLGRGDYLGWTAAMLPELHRLFPHHLCMQSLGSFDADGIRTNYRKLALMPGNDVAQVHRYLDLGARLEVCHGPVDVLTSEAVRELLVVKPGKPVILAETGAVEPSHSGPFKLYPKDKKGVLLHDILFAPFFAGAAGAGQCWHWDSYVDANNLWWQFGRFAAATKGLDPPAEHFEPVLIDHAAVRVYLLKGQKTWIAWCRDKASDWRTELAEGHEAAPLRDVQIRLGIKEGRCRVYDPWADRWSEATCQGGTVTLPEFTRSIVVRIEK